jgi:type III secretion protein J
MKYSLIFFITVLGFFLTGCSSQKAIVNGLDERDANEIIVFLASKGIDSQKIQAKSEGPGGGGAVLWVIVVDSRVATDAMGILNSNGLPRKKTQKLLEIFAAGGLVPSEMQETIRYQAGLAEQISGTIRKIDGILDADVQLSFPEADPLNPKNTTGKVTASVFVKHQGVLDDPNSHLVAKIRRLVASSVQGLDFENVTVISDRGRFSNAQAQEVKSRNEVELVRVWTIAVAKDSVGRFQLIFTMILLFLVLTVLLLLWFLWRMLSLIRAQGILPAIFSKISFSLESLEEPVDK